MAALIKQRRVVTESSPQPSDLVVPAEAGTPLVLDRKSTRLNSSHLVISYAVFCLKKKNNARARGSRLRSRAARLAPALATPDHRGLAHVRSVRRVSGATRLRRPLPQHLADSRRRRSHGWIAR